MREREAPGARSRSSPAPAPMKLRLFSRRRVPERCGTLMFSQTLSAMSWLSEGTASATRLERISSTGWMLRYELAIVDHLQLSERSKATAEADDDLLIS